ncbi:MAG: helix-turn-helix domain-containing protein [Deltaproteobacteria bacterium]|nr:helix-turn-helix domain-containing protein [Deltaproteobacteria bacterium]
MAKKKKKDPETAPGPSQETYTLSDLEQVKVLAQPLRIRLLENFCQERTTKQVADLLGEKPTRLYHHVEALERVGLIRQTKTRPNRGTVEKYFQAVARTFRADSALFSANSSDEDVQALQSVVDTLMDTTAGELRQLVGSGSGAALEEEGLLSMVEIRATSAEITEIRDRLEGLIRGLGQVGDEDRPEDSAEEAGGVERRFRLMLALFPLDSQPEPPSSS